MTAYATRSDMEVKFGATELALITDRSAGAEIDDAVLNAALGSAAAEIDAALRVRYRLPIASPQPLLKDIACDLARYALYDNQPSETVVDRAKTARAQLAKLSDGTMHLDAEEASKGSGASTGGGVRFSPGVRVFTSDALAGYR
ncbi:MAG: gp436 family protein [Rhodospirillaceae bacterium]